LLAGAVFAPPAWGASRVPRTRYDFADRCLAVRGGEPLFFKATALARTWSATGPGGC
jgi:hypothetical protein